MKARKKDMGVRELFRQKLEKAEVVPGESVKSKLMHRLARKEFLHFNPARFNIYYLGGILVAGIITALILSSGAAKSDQQSNSKTLGETGKKGKSEKINIQVNQTVIPRSDKLIENSTEQVKNKPAYFPAIKSEKEPVPGIKPRQTDNITHKEVNDSFVIKGLFAEESDNKYKLKGGFKIEETLFEPSATKGCIPLKIHFYNKSSSYDSCKWTFGDGGYSSESSPEWIYDVEGDYKVVLNLYGKNGLNATSSTVITVHPKPQARFEISPEKASIPYDEIRFLNYSTNAVNFNWDLGDGSYSDLFEPRHRYSKFSNYNVRLVVSSDYGCLDSLTVINAFSGSEYFIEFPNAFIPNTQGPIGGTYSTKSDENALVFHPVFSGVTDYKLRIFSKIGILIFETSDINLGWDGYFKGQLCDPGVYIWKVRGNFRNGEPFIKMGDVTLIKN